MSHEVPVISIACGADQKFFPGLMVALASAVATASGRFNYKIYIIDGGLLEESSCQLERLLLSIGATIGISVHVEYASIAEHALDIFPAWRGSRMTFLKLLLPEVLRSVSNVIYIDSDILCFIGVEAVIPVAQQELTLLAGVLDFYSQLEDDCPWKNTLSTEERRLPYINCGLLWMNLDLLRRQEISRRAFELVETTKDLRFGDQTLFNYLCRGQIQLLPKRLNFRPSLGNLCRFATRCNLHLIGTPKPWIGAPKCYNWLPHRLWSQAYGKLIASSDPVRIAVPSDLNSARLKSLIYLLFNPRRSRDYRDALNSIIKGEGALNEARIFWDNILKNKKCQ
jgi:lipopolysaccharide biosynthesis glycosyltransferase